MRVEVRDPETGAYKGAMVLRYAWLPPSFGSVDKERDAVGLNDRGRIAPGYKADLNVIDFDNLRVEAPVMKWDLPAGGKRLLQKAEGYLHTFVSGVEVYADGAHTGALPGRLVRGARS